MDFPKCVKINRQMTRQEWNTKIREFLDRDLEDFSNEEFKKGLIFHYTKQEGRDMGIFGYNGVKQFIDTLDYKIVDFDYGRVEGDFLTCFVRLFFNDYRED